MSRHGSEEKVSVYRIGRTVYFFDDINSSTVCEAIKLIDEIQTESLKKPIEFVINSGGGTCYDGLALYDKLRSSECNILMVGTGIVGSMALIVYLAGDNRILTENTRLLNHQMSSGEEGMRLNDLAIDYKETAALDEIMMGIISERTGISMNKLKKEVLPGDKWISAEEAVEEGYAHELIHNKRTRRRRKSTKK